MERQEGPMPWWQVIAVMVAVGLGAGLLLGLLGTLIDLPDSVTIGGVGGAIGAIGAHLLTRRRAKKTP